MLQSLSIYERLAKENPKAYQPDLAGTLNNLGLLYFQENRRKEALQSYLQSLSIYERLAKENPKAYGPDLAATLHNLGLLYKDKKQKK